MTQSNTIFRDIALCLVFFTRLPLPVIDFRERKLADAIWAAPIVGLVVAIPGAVAYAIAARFGVAAGPAAALALAAMIVATGCLHEDGLSDIADGFGGGRTRERKLEIMHDSRIGAYGAAALGLSLLIRWSVLSQLAGPGEVLAALVAAHCASRATFGAFLRQLPPARDDGLSATIGAVSSQAATISLALGAIGLLFLGIGPAVAAIVLLGLIFLTFKAFCRAQIGGHTGDAAGALQQFGEIAVLLVASVSLS
jgi:adenosylcobinamide-GDP ribazoletransferase